MDTQTEKPMDSWHDDLNPGLVVAHRATSGGDGLTPRLRELRDGVSAGPSQRIVSRRKEQIVELEQCHTKLLLTLSEMDKYRAHSDKADCHPDVLSMMDELIVTRMKKFRDVADDIHRSLTQLRNAVDR